MTLMQIGLDDKYRLDSKRIYLSGIQALVRLPMLQRERDRLQNLNTAGFISGYRGSPLGMYDSALWKAKSFLQSQDIAFVPGLNEDLAATAVWGSQQVGMFPGAKVDGVFGIWYGKGPGVDRSVDALKHANSAGTSRNGGVIALAGDDHGCQSSTLAHQSDQVFAAALMPVFNPATLQDYLDLGLYGFALSRFSGCWVGFKAISETVESSASIYSDPSRIQVVLPTDFEMPPGGLNIRWPDAPLEQERRLHGPKMDAVAAFARANQLDRVVLDSKPARLGIAATGKAYLDLRQALADLGITERDAQDLGLRIYKIAMTWPLEESGARRFAEGLQDVLVVEEKRGFIEDQLVRILYNMDASKRPSVVGKRDERGAVLLPSEGELTPTMVAAALVARLRRLGHQSPALEQRLARLEAFEHPATAHAPMALQRTPYFCSGCPHNTSTKIPEGSRAMAGIGCHGMALSVPSRRTALISHMGAEGVSWIGQAPFTTEPHIFQNLGDGTYTHSGLLALRAAAAAGVNITYKILYNDAVAMTGGQPAEGGLTVSQIAHQVWAEGAKRLAIVSDDPGKYPNKSYFPAGATVHHRRDMDQVQRELREVKGLSVLVYDQTCAAEKRRRRKRGLYPDPPKRVFINDLVCEGCGDCSQASNCVSVQPLDTEFGRKRQIDQSNCNKDYSCVEGFCPSFVTVHGGTLKQAQTSSVDSGQLFADLPLPPQRQLEAPYNILVTGIGGTGVITIGALLGMAAHLDGHGCSALDFTGLAQKNGAVMSHVRIAPSPEDISTVRIASGGADLILGCDIVVSANPTALSRVERGVTLAIVNADLQPTASFVMNPDIDFEMNAMQDALRSAVGDNNLDIIDATGIASALMGDSIATNAFMLGLAFQKGAIPLSLEGILRAIEINGAAVEMNKQAFAWGRLAAHDLARVRSVTQFRARAATTTRTLDETIAYRAKFLSEYQNRAYADRYLTAVTRVRSAEAEASPGSSELTEAVAKNLFKLMAYKDEYEVARLYTDGAFVARLGDKFEGDVRLKFHLAAPLLARRDKVTGHLQKKEYGGWIIHVFRLLARLKFLRGTAFDPFGYTAERRAERKLIDDYFAMIEQHIMAVKARGIPLLARLARLPEMIRGYGHIKEQSIANALAEKARLEPDLENSRFRVAAE
ncbi:MULTISPECIES: indolepyruvate ferredoxin oxidoreductase family protein [unclassified Bradyrhizobium]|uniref:indolepyruvate ferredoxin oxidoreductase family protein n=1 Tax=unclassified Bradyrhizobium TaxID=2631580 RepID=UPI001FF9F10D|nr:MULTISPECIES: indolepyruvate ferredoxin oxidoreductase family protein [unclassified Bradyrhizobium]MCK1319063.1 indolepyruvate ferredoxin oxidoreductase family protein [Bradyrhizobium sp. 23]MCK1505115.1 indolepyruvate ferredoxin oxidoreductase family protein [Bradyrhizobium sp. 18]